MNLFEKQANEFSRRHIGSNEEETRQMLSSIGVKTLEELIDKAIPASIRNPTATTGDRSSKRGRIPGSDPGNRV